MLLPTFESRQTWVLPQASPLEPDVRGLAAELGVGDRLLRVLARRGIATVDELRSLVTPPEQLLHDPLLLPDAEHFRDRIRLAAGRGERVLVFGDFDADGLTGLAILVRALRRLGIDAEPYVPSRTDEGHGLSLGAVERALAESRSLIVTADCGTTSVVEIGAARDAGIDVLVTDHHAVPAVLPPAIAIVNAHRPGSRYPDSRLSGAGIAFKLALLILDQPADRAFALGLADLACIGSVADVVPITGENRAILRLGLRALAAGERPGLVALLTSAGVDPRRVDVEQIGYTIAPRINAVGRVGQADAAARLLLTDDPAAAEALAAELEAANTMRRELMASALEEARAALAADAAMPGSAIVVAGPWPVGIVGLVAGRLADEHGLPAIVFSTTVQPWRGSARGVPGFDLAAAFAQMADLFERFGGHPMAAGCHLPEANYAAFRVRVEELASAAAPVAVGASGPDAANVGTVEAKSEPPQAEPGRRSRRRDGRPLVLDLVLRAESADYVLLRELAPLDEGADDPPVVGLAGFVVTRIRRVRGDHTQLTLRRDRDVIDGICFGRSDLSETLQEGTPIDLVARLSSRTFGGFESLQLDVRDVAPAGTLRRLAAASAVTPLATDVVHEATVTPPIGASDQVDAGRVAVPIIGEPTPLALTG